MENGGLRGRLVAIQIYSIKGQSCSNTKESKVDHVKVKLGKMINRLRYY